LVDYLREENVGSMDKMDVRILEEYDRIKGSYEVLGKKYRAAVKRGDEVAAAEIEKQMMAIDKKNAAISSGEGFRQA